MKKQKTEKTKNKGPKTNNGITLIALVITIIVMLILVAVTISMAINGGLFGYAGKAAGDTQNAIDAEQQLGSGKVQIDGVWYDSIDDYIDGNQSTGTEGGLQIELSIAGEKVITVPVPTGFTHKEGTIDEGYVIINETDGNEFVWIPVDKNQKITLKIASLKDVKEVKLYDPYGDEILALTDDKIETTYSNTNIEPTINGLYVAKVITEDGVTWKKLAVRSLYAIDSFVDFMITDEYAQYNGYTSYQEQLQSTADRFYDGSLENMFQARGVSCVEEYEAKLWAGHKAVYKDLEDYTESVNKNGGFYIARYEAGSSTPKTSSGLISDTPESVISEYGKPVSKKGFYPYVHVDYTMALGLAKSMYVSDMYTASLLTGSAWDRTLGWIYETGKKNMEELILNSHSWGNYYDVEIEIKTGKYSANNGVTYTDVSNKYLKEKYNAILLTTGATIRNSTNNIFDLVGNVGEWTSETQYTYNVFRGGYYLGESGGDHPASGRYALLVSGSDYAGFRVALYLQ